MSFFEYVSVFVSIIVALGITQLLLGFSRVIERPRGQRIYWVHLVWVVWLFLQLLFFWWAEFRLEGVEEWTFYGYSVVALLATALFLLSAILFPSGSYEGVDFEERFFERRRWFFGLQLVWLGIDQLDTLLKGVDYYRTLGLEYPIAVAILSVLFLIAIWTPNRKYHGALAIGILLLWLQWIGRNYYTVA